MVLRSEMLQGLPAVQESLRRYRYREGFIEDTLWRANELLDRYYYEKCFDASFDVDEPSAFISPQLAQTVSDHIKKQRLHPYWGFSYVRQWEPECQAGLVKVVVESLAPSYLNPIQRAKKALSQYDQLTPEIVNDLASTVERKMKWAYWDYPGSDHFSTSIFMNTYYNEHSGESIALQHAHEQGLPAKYQRKDETGIPSKEYKAVSELGRRVGRRAIHQLIRSATFDCIEYYCGRPHYELQFTIEESHRAEQTETAWRRPSRNLSEIVDHLLKFENPF